MSVIGVMVGLHASGFEFTNKQSEDLRPYAHFMNLLMMMFYVTAFSLLSIKLRECPVKLSGEHREKLVQKRLLKA